MPAAPLEFRTPRLLLIPLQLADAPAIQQVFPQWDIVRYLADAVPWPYPDDGALTYLRDVALPAMRAGRQWHWTLRPRLQPRELIGMISLMNDNAENQRGFWLAPRWQGQGLMTEACGPVTDYWFDALGQPVLRIAKAAANTASRRISERSGMRLVATGMRNYVCGPLATETWEITRAAWQARRRDATAP